MSRRRAWLTPLFLALSCSGAASESSLEVHESGDLSTVIARDGDGREVARLELLHGPFTLSDAFAEGVVERRVVGRRLEVRAGDQVLRWETDDFFPTMSLPPHPAGQDALAAFLEEERVRQLLVSWGIAFAAVADDDDPYQFVLNGTNACKCVGTTCPTIVGPTPGACAGVSSDYAFVVHQRASGGYLAPDTATGTPYDQSFVAQCCPYLSDAQPAIFAKKSCPDTPTRPAMGSCGLTTGICKACPTYLSKGNCRVRVEAAGWSDPDAPLLSPSVAGYPLYCGEATARTADEQRAVMNVSARFGWTCGDGTCDAGEETCASCPADCGTPATRCPDGYECGTVDDGCGGTLDCAGGLSCEEIVGKKHWECVADSHRCCKHGRCK